MERIERATAAFEFGVVPMLLFGRTVALRADGELDCKEVGAYLTLTDPRVCLYDEAPLVRRMLPGEFGALTLPALGVTMVI